MSIACPELDMVVFLFFGNYIAFRINVKHMVISLHCCFAVLKRI